MSNGWNFDNNTLLELEKKLSPEEYEQYGFSSCMDLTEKQFFTYMGISITRIEEDLFKQKMDFNKNRTQFQR